MTSSVFAVIFAFPVAYFLAFCVERSKYTWLLIVITPFLTSYLLRIFAWKVILGDQGVVNSALASLGLISKNHPLSFLIYSQFTVIVVLMYAWVSFICLPIFISLENIDRRLLEAATDLGASRFKAFRQITLPLAAPGVIAAFLFVFIPSIGEYITPSLVGGMQGYMFGQRIADKFVGQAFDWQGGAVLALFLMAVVLVLTAATSRFLRAGRRRGMSAAPAPAPVAAARRRRRGSGGSVVISRNGRIALTAFFVLFLVFLYLPTLILIIFSFNSSTVQAFPLTGFTTSWYRGAWNDPTIHEALKNSIVVASVVAVIATVLARDGLLPARATQRSAARPRSPP